MVVNRALLDSDAVAGFASVPVMKSSHQKVSSSGAGMILLSETLSHQQMYSSPPKAPCCNPEGQPLQANQENSKFKFHFISVTVTQGQGKPFKESLKRILGLENANK